MPKRYYWLKLKDDFFGSKRIKKLRNMAGGDTYLIIYLKMQLLAMKTEGVLTWTGLEDNFAAELALDLDEKPSDVEMTLLYLLNTGLAETQDNQHFFFPYAVENTGSETAAAQRMREYRGKNAEPEKQPAQLPAKTNAERQRAHRAKLSAQEKQHIPFIEDYANRNRYGGNYYLVCQRDRFKCAICGSIENLCVHHIDGYSTEKPQNNAMNKMILLCRECHSNVHAGKPIPQEILDIIDYEKDDIESETVTNNGDCNVTCSSNGYVEKEIEIESEKEIERENARARLKTREDEKDDGFQAFWAAYPKKNGGDIREAFMEYDHATESLGVPKETLIESAKELAEATAPEEIRFLPNAAKWLRNRGWETKAVKAEPKIRSYTTAAEAKPRTKIDTGLLDAVKSAMQQEME